MLIIHFLKMQVLLPMYIILLPSTQIDALISNNQECNTYSFVYENVLNHYVAIVW